MNCMTDGTLRSQLDGELDQRDSAAVHEHLAACADCRSRAAAIRAQSESVQTVLAGLSPRPDEVATDASFAFARFKARHDAGAAPRPGLFNRLFARRRVPVWGALAAIVILGVSFSFAPQALADKLLGLFRVSKITVVSVDSNRVRNGEGGLLGRQIGQLLSDDIAYISEPGKPQPATSAAQASELAGLTVRLPGARSDAAKLTVEGENAFEMTVNRSRLQSILDEAGRTDLQLPASLDGAKITVDIPKAVVAVYGNCPQPGPHMSARKQGDWADCVALAQVRTPSVVAPADLNISQVAELGLQLTGMSADEARAFSQNVDWTSTLVIPIPREAASYQQVQVDGVSGTLIIQKAVEDRPEGYTLLWLKHGVIYSLTGFGDAAQAVRLADSLK